MKIVVDRPDNDELKEMGVETWPVWEHGEEKIECFYDKTERCYIVSGEATIVSEFETLTIKPGDFITFPAGLECIWDIDYAIRKRYIIE
jgi:hypothetical protein